MERCVLPPIAISGAQLAILIYAIGFLGVPTAQAVTSWLSLTHDDTAYLSQVISMGVELVAIMAIPALRSRAKAFVSVPVARRDLPEVAVLCLAVIVAQFALFGAYAMTHWLHGGDEAVRKMVLDPSRGPDQAFAAVTLRNLVIATLVAPVVEEIVFRGFLFQAWAQQHRTFTAMILTSAVFALCHPTFLFPFALGLLVNSLYLRTGALRAGVFVHFVANAAFWYPFLGQFIFPTSNSGLSSWRLHLACLAVFTCFTVCYPAIASFSSHRKLAASDLPVPA